MSFATGSVLEKVFCKVAQETDRVVDSGILDSDRTPLMRIENEDTTMAQHMVMDGIFGSVKRSRNIESLLPRLNSTRVIDEEG